MRAAVSTVVHRSYLKPVRKQDTQRYKKLIFDINIVWELSSTARWPGWGLKDESPQMTLLVHCCTRCSQVIKWIGTFSKQALDVPQTSHWVAEDDTKNFSALTLTLPADPGGSHSDISLPRSNSSPTLGHAQFRQGCWPWPHRQQFWSLSGAHYFIH